MSTHTLSCPCGMRQDIDGWLDALEVRKLHNRTEGCAAVVDLSYSREAS